MQNEHDQTAMDEGQGTPAEVALLAGAVSPERAIINKLRERGSQGGRKAHQNRMAALQAARDEGRPAPCRVRPGMAKAGAAVRKARLRELQGRGLVRPSWMT
jgi:hypothetical protein